jgi:hypothetical protein
VQHAGERDVIDVVSGARRKRAFLAPAGHTPVDEPWILCERLVRPEPEPLHHAGAKAFDQHIGARDELERGLRAGSRLQIECHRALAAQHDVVPALALEAEARGAGSIDHEHVGPHVGEQHSGERRRTDRLELEHLHASERPSHGLIITNACALP